MGARRASIRDVAALAGVSVGTVSNVLNRPERVAVGTRERVLAAVDKLGFVRNESARQLRAGASGLVGLVVLDAANPFFADVAEGAERVLVAAGYSMMVASSAEDAARERRHLELFERVRAEGVLLSPVHRGGEVDELRRRGTPVVLVDRATDRRAECSVAVDDVTGGTLAATHLLQLGHRRLAVVGGPASLRQVAERQAGVRAAVAGFADGSGRWARLDVVETAARTIAEGRAAGERLAALPADDRPTGLVALNDLVALGLLQALTLAGLRVPDDVAIVGYDDIDFAAAATIPLSSVRQPRQELGARAAELLLEEMTAPGEHEHAHVTFAPRLVARQSTLGRAGAAAAR